MSNRRDRERRRGVRRENRHERRQKQHSGGGWSAINVPEGMEVFKPESGKTYHIDVIPYITGKLNKNADPGDEYFELSYPAYSNVGVAEKRYVAIGEMCGTRDPVAERLARMRREGASKDELKPYKHTWRQLMLFFVHEQADKGLQLFEGACGTIGEVLDEEIEANEEDYIDNFDDPDAGATLVVRFKAKSIGQANPWVRATKIDFEEREDGFTANGNSKLAEKILAQAAGICLDDLLKIPDYETLSKVLDGEPVDDEDAEPDEADTDTDTDADVDDDAETKPKHSKAKPKPAEDDDAENDSDEGDNDGDDDDDEKEAPPPKPKTGSTKPKPKPKAPPTAEALGITKGIEVVHSDFGVCSVLRITDDGATLTLMDADDDIHKGVPVGEVDVAEPDDGDGGGDDDEKEAPPPKTSGEEKPKTKTKPATKEDDWDDDWDDEGADKDKD